LIEGGPGVEAQFLQLYLAVATLVALPAAAELKRRSRLFSELERNAAIHRLIIDRTGDLLMTTDVLGTITYTSPSIRTVTGYGAMELVGRRVRDVVAEQDREVASVAHATALRDPSRTVMVEFRAHRATGETGWFESHIRAIVSETGETIGAVSIVREISDRKARESDLAAAAATDPLTGLANRRAFEAAYDRLSVAGHGHSIGCLAVFDLDHFKLVNDLHGHAAGDAVLHGFADILAREVRTGDVVARIGGEEFAVILVDSDLEQAEAICDRIRRVLWAWSVSAPTGAALRPTVSVGIAPIREDSTREETLEAADRALYRAKDRGRNRLAIAS
jgi:diguanylate cyclase (GGDEF)-like protein/PAS domain S-box-containing protein